MGDIYAIKRKDIDKIVYIGQTIRTYKIRWQQHKQTSKNADASRYALYAAIQKFGIDNFYPILIEQCDNSLLDEREIYWIKYYKTKIELGGYNLTDGGDTKSFNQKKHIYRYDKEGNFIDEFDSILDAAYKIGEPQWAITIGKAAKNKTSISHGYRWSFEKHEKLDQPSNVYRKEIKQYTKDGQYLKTFSSIKEATESLGLFNNGAGSNIIAVAKGKRKSAYGYSWGY